LNSADAMPQPQMTLPGPERPTPTLLFNGYADQVAELYKGLEGEKLYM
jgi:methionine sulfoxide reductase catalytic subunit